MTSHLHGARHTARGRGRTRPARALRPLAALAAMTLLALTITGCFNPFDPRVLGRGISEPPPAPNSASGVLRLLEWAYTNRDYPVYKTLFTDDYRFAFAALDTAGNSYRQTPWTREDELAYSQNLFEGGDANQPAATNITLVLDKSFNEFADPREGKKDDFTRFRAIRTQVALNITDAYGAQTNVSGKALFFLVRGDSAVIPPELGLGPDVNRWYINRWEDETYSPVIQQEVTAGGPSAAAARPAPAMVLAASPALGTGHRLVRRDAARSTRRSAPGARAGATPAWGEFPYYEASWGLLKRVYR